MNASDGVHKTDYYVKWICRHQQLHQLSNLFFHFLRTCYTFLIEIIMKGIRQASISHAKMMMIPLISSMHDRHLTNLTTPTRQHLSCTAHTTLYWRTCCPA